MDSKSIVLEKNERMKFFKVILISSFLAPSWACLCDALDILEPSHQLYSQYSKPHNLLPKNGAPNTSCPIQETPAGVSLKIVLSVSLLAHLRLAMEDILYTYECDLCSQLLSKFGHPHYHKFEPISRDISFSNRPLIHDSDILSPTLYDNLNYLLYESSCDKNPYNKTKTFIETKVTAMN